MTAADLNKLLSDIFEDGIVEPKEREALKSCTEAMSADQTLSVFKEFIGKKWGEAMADDILTAAEIRLLTHIMEELDLDLKDLPQQAQLALRGAV